MNPGGQIHQITERPDGTVHAICGHCGAEGEAEERTKLAYWCYACGAFLVAITRPHWANPEQTDAA